MQRSFAALHARISFSRLARTRSRWPWLLLLFLTAGFAQAEVYQWRDAEGRLQFGDRPPAGVKATPRELRVNTYEAEPVPEAMPEAAPTAERPKPKRVVLYSASWCRVCDRARHYLVERKIPFTEYDVEATKQGQRDFLAMGGKGVPIILVGRQRFEGFSPEALEAALAAP